MSRRRARRAADDDFPAPDELDGMSADDGDKSKSQRKRELLALDPLVAEIVELSERQFASLPLSEGLAAALRAARPMTRAARKRQLRYARGLLATEDHVAVLTAVQRLKQPQRAAVAVMHELEDWRERLIAGDEALEASLLARYPALDGAELRRLIDDARAARDHGRGPRAARTLFRRLGEIRGDAD
jgi:ribosome-associated protein